MDVPLLQTDYLNYTNMVDGYDLSCQIWMAPYYKLTLNYTNMVDGYDLSC